MLTFCVLLSFSFSYLFSSSFYLIFSENAGNQLSYFNLCEQTRDCCVQNYVVCCVGCTLYDFHHN